MPTGMQTGRRTGSSMRSGVSAPAGGGGPLQAIQQKWNAIEPNKKTMIIVSVAFVLIAIIIVNVLTTANKPVPLFSSNMEPTDVQAIDNKLNEWRIPHEVEPGSINILIHPQYKHKALLQLANIGLPKRPVKTTSEFLSGKSGMVPDTADDKNRKMLMALEGDLTVTIRQIEGVADAYVKIVPQPETTWGEDKGSASAAIMLKLYPDTKLSKEQIQGIVHLATSSVAGLAEERVKVVDTSGRTLNSFTNQFGGGAGSGDGGYTNTQIEERRAIEKDLQAKVQQSLDKILGTGRSQAVVSVEMDYSQTEQEMTKVGGPTNTSGTVETGKSQEVETYGTTASSGNSNGYQELSGTSGGDKSNYKKVKIVSRTVSDTSKIRKVNTAPTIKRVSCSVMVDGVKDPETLAKIKDFAANAINLTPSRGDEIAVSSIPFAQEDLLKEYEAAAALPSWKSRQPYGGAIPGWLPMVLGIPFIIILALVALFYVKQKNVQREKQRLVLTAGPGSTVSDISDLLADKEGKVTAPPPTKVNTTDQLENLAKEKPTKVAELLKSTWLADK